MGSKGSFNRIPQDWVATSRSMLIYRTRIDRMASANVETYSRHPLPWIQLGMDAGRSPVGQAESILPPRLAI